MPRSRVSPVGVSTPKLMMEMPSLEADGVLVERTSWPEENMIDQALEEPQQSNLKSDNHAGTVVEETQENSDGVPRDEGVVGFKEFPQPGVGNADVPVDEVMTGPVPVPRKHRLEGAPIDTPHPMPRRSQRSMAGVHNNPNRLPKSACNAVSFSPDVLSQVLANIVLYTSGKLQGVLDN